MNIGEEKLRRCRGFYLQIFTEPEVKPEVKWRQCGPVVGALALRSGDPGFKTRSNHSLNLFLVVPGSTSPLHL